MSDTMASVVLWRVFQAVGACVGPMLSRAMISDLFGSSQAAQMLSTLVIIMAIAWVAGTFTGRRDTGVRLLARDILADGAS